MYKVLVCGGRDFTDWETVGRTLDSLNSKYKNLHIIQGGAKGADRLAKEWAKEMEVPCTEYRANWKKYGKAAGVIRNLDMLDAEPDMVIAFKGGNGTAHMVEQSTKKNIPVHQIGD